MDSITQEDVIRIMELVEKTNTDELQLETDGLKLTIRKNVAAQETISAPAVQTVAVAADQDDVASLSASGGGKEREEAHAGGEPLDTEGAIEIKAPMLGTFYKAPKPGAPPFVEVGRTVDKNDTVCIIEVMKLFSTIKSGVQGRVVKVLAKDGEMVEFGQPLFLIEAGASQEASK